MYSTAPLADARLKNYWQFNNGTGVTLTDSKGSANGTLNNMNNSNWVTSTIPFAAGDVNTQIVNATGTNTFTGTGLSMNFTAKSGTDTVVVSRIDTVSNNSSTVVSRVFDSQYWVVNSFGSGTSTANLTFTVNEVLTSSQQSRPDRIKLFYRSSNSDGAWTFVCSATSVNATNNTATFNGITSFGQFIICDISPRGIPGTALQFDGINDYVSCPAPSGGPPPVSTGGSMTLEAWINADTWKSNSWEGTIAGNENTNHTGYCLRCGDDGRLSFVIGSSGSWHEVISNPVMSTGIWYHVVGVYDGSQLRIYINGNLEGQISSSAPDQSTQTFYIGNSPGNPTRYFNGKIDEVSVWVEGRTQSEIQYDMCHPMAANSYLQNYWQFNEGTGTTLYDVAGRYDGTLTNMDAATCWVESYAQVVPVPGDATNITSTGFTANWTAPVVGTFTSYKLDVSTNSTFTAMVTGYNNLDCGNNLSKNVTGLASGTAYYYRIRADKTSVTGTGANYYTYTTTATCASPTISSQSTASQCLNGTFTPITVTASGTGNTYQWYSNTSASNSGGTSLGTNNGAQTYSYTPQATTVGTLYYYCVVSGTCGAAQTSAVSGAFIVNPLTNISSQSTATQTQYVNAAYTAITVTATGANLTYQWYSNANANNSGGTSLGSNNGAQTYSYTPQSNAAGTLYYYCIVTGTCGTTTINVSGAFITTIPPPPTINSFTPATGPVGTLVIITGTDLSNSTAFTIGGATAIVVSNNGTTLVGMVMPGAAADILSITTAGGTATSSSNFTVTPTLYPRIQQGNKLVGNGSIGNPQQGFSISVSADGNTAIVGGFYDNNNQGAAWVYTRTGSAWTQQAKLVGTGNSGAAQQGSSVALSADGNTAIVGGWYDNLHQGAAWIFTRSSGVWSQQGSKLVGTGNIGYALQGTSVSLSADGSTAIVGGYYDNDNVGAVWVYTRTGSVWTQQARLVGTGWSGFTCQGISVSLSADGNTAIVGGYRDNSDQGAAWVFTRSAGVWSQQGSKLVGTGSTGAARQGNSVSISADGNTAIVGGYQDNSNQGATWVYTRSAGIWSQQGNKLVGTGNTGAATQGGSVAISSDGTTAMMGGYGDNSNMGAAWVFIPCINPSIGGTIAGDQTGSSPFYPSTLTSTANPNGQSGTLEYKWQQSTTSSSAGFSDIPNSNAATYAPGSLTATTWYKRLARVSCKSDWTGAAASNVVKITVNPPTKTLNVTAMLQGYYDIVDNNDLMLQSQDVDNDGNSINKWSGILVDTLTIQIRSTIFPDYRIEQEFPTSYINTDGTITLSGTVSGSLTGYHYIVIKHWKSIETWSDSTNFSNNTINYNFYTNAASTQFPNNMTNNVSGNPANGNLIWAGDITDGNGGVGVQDGYVTLDDMFMVYDANLIVLSGYEVLDINGDGYVTLDDMFLVYDNNLVVAQVVNPITLNSKKK